jgi:hypothetical protein
MHQPVLRVSLISSSYLPYVYDEIGVASTTTFGSPTGTYSGPEVSGNFVLEQLLLRYSLRSGFAFFAAGPEVML